MQQVKEKGQNPRDQTNEEEMGSLPEKEFTVKGASELIKAFLENKY